MQPEASKWSGGETFRIQLKIPFRGKANDRAAMLAQAASHIGFHDETDGLRRSLHVLLL